MTAQRFPGHINARHGILLSPQKYSALSSQQSWDVSIGLLMSSDSEDTPGGGESWGGGVSRRVWGASSPHPAVE